MVSSSNKESWLKWAMELQFLAQAGITYSKDPYDLERFQHIRDISAEMVSFKTAIDLKKVKDLFCNETGFQTPKIDTRAAIFNGEQILLVKEKNNTWSLPGGWVDVNESIKTNTIKEVKEESGYTVNAVKLIAAQNRNLHNFPIYAYGICKVFVLCEILDSNEAFITNNETVERNFFSLQNLPHLATEKNTANQIKLCFEAKDDPNWQTKFD